MKKGDYNNVLVLKIILTLLQLCYKRFPLYNLKSFENKENKVLKQVDFIRAFEGNW